MYLLLALLLLPIVEIALFIQVGGLIGLWPTLALVILAAVGGSWLVRQQGLRVAFDLQRAMGGLSDPRGPLAHGGLVLLAGVLLMIPGFFTDVLALLLLIPPVRNLLLRRLAGRIRVGGFGPRGRTGRHPDAIDADYIDVTPKDGAEPGSDDAFRTRGDGKGSGWTGR